MRENTYHESWYKVEAMRVRLSPGLEVIRQKYRKQIWFVIQDRGNNSFFRVNSSGWYFVSLLDGRRSIGEAWNLASECLGDAAPTQPEAIRILGQLFNNNLLLSDIPPDVAELLRRYDSRVSRQIQTYLKNILFAKIPLLDPDEILERGAGLARIFFSKAWVIAASLIGLFTVFLLLEDSRKLMGESQSEGMFSPGNIFIMYVIFVVSKLIHEFSHGFACKILGQANGRQGEVHQMGINLMLLTPVPYVDCSSSWALKSKCQRAFIAGAGMYAELHLAILAAFVWMGSSDHSLAHSIAYNVMFVCSVTTVLFNINPLMRFDGYYILADLLEIPNLATRSNKLFLDTMKRHVLGCNKLPPPTGDRVERAILMTYAPLAFLMRLVVFGGIFFTLYHFLPLLGLFMISCWIFAMLVKPVWSYFSYLRKSPELRDCRGRAWAVSSAATLALLFLLGGINVPDRIRVDAVAEPLDYADIHMLSDGFVDSFHPDAAPVSAGAPLLRASNPNLEAELKSTAARVAELQVERNIAFEKDLAKAQILDDQIAFYKERCDELRRRLGELVIPAPFEGVWMLPDEALSLQGRFFQQGQKVGAVSSRRILIRGIATQEQAGRLIEEFDLRGEKNCRFRVRGAPDLQSEDCRVVKILPAGVEKLPSASLGFGGGGDVAIDQQEKSGMKTVERHFEVHVAPGEQLPDWLKPGQRISLQLDMEDKPAAQLLYLWVRQVFLKNLS
ncbi:MAG: hypothetical protein RL095_1511 [Verrucomicrobiota bacterium]|jgi:putative peptide zinc metalloprotease protein